MRTKKAYYYVQVTRDGIIVFAFERRKPIKRRGRTPTIDPDGVCDEYADDPDEAGRYTDWGKGVRMTAITTHLNVRRLLREFVEPRLLAIDQRLDVLQDQLGRIEAKLMKRT
jgi:hypothetical protein